MTTEAAAAGEVDRERARPRRSPAAAPPRPARGPARDASLGLVAASSTRFAAATARPVAVRRALAAAATVPARSIGQAEVRPPRWWTPGLTNRSEQAEAGVPQPAVPAAAARTGPRREAGSDRRAAALAGHHRRWPGVDRHSGAPDGRGHRGRPDDQLARAAQVARPRPAPPAVPSGPGAGGPGAGGSGAGGSARSGSGTAPPGNSTGSGNSTSARAASAGAVSQNSGEGVAAALRRSAARATAALRPSVAGGSASAGSGSAGPKPAVAGTGRAAPSSGLVGPSPATALRRRLAIRRAEAEQHLVAGRLAAASAYTVAVSGSSGVRGGDSVAVPADRPVGALASGGASVPSAVAAAGSGSGVPTSVTPAADLAGGSGGAVSGAAVSEPGGFRSDGSRSAGPSSAGPSPAGPSPAGPSPAGPSSVGPSSVGSVAGRQVSTARSLLARPGGRVASLTAAVARRLATPSAASEPVPGAYPVPATTSPAAPVPVLPALPSAHETSPDAWPGSASAAAGAPGTLRRRLVADHSTAPVQAEPLPSARVGMLRRAVGVPTAVPTAARPGSIRPATMFPAAQSEEESRLARAGRTGAVAVSNVPSPQASAKCRPSNVPSPSNVPGQPGQRIPSSAPQHSTSDLPSDVGHGGQFPIAAGTSSVRRNLAAGAASVPDAGTRSPSAPSELVAGLASPAANIATDRNESAGSTSAQQARPALARHAAPTTPGTAEPGASRSQSVVGLLAGSAPGRPLSLASLRQPIRRSVALAGSQAAGAGNRSSAQGSLAHPLGRPAHQPGQPEPRTAALAQPAGQRLSGLAALAAIPSALGSGGSFSAGRGGSFSAGRGQLPSAIQRSAQLRPAVRPGSSVRPVWSASAAAGVAAASARSALPAASARSVIPAAHRTPSAVSSVVSTQPAYERATARSVAEPIPAAGGPRPATFSDGFGSSRSRPGSNLPATTNNSDAPFRAATTWSGRSALDTGRVLRAIVPGTVNTESSALPVALRTVAGQLTPADSGALSTRQPRQRYQQPIDAPVRRQVSGTIRPQYLPATGHQATATGHQPVPAQPRVPANRQASVPQPASAQQQAPVYQHTPAHQQITAQQPAAAHRSAAAHRWPGRRCVPRCTRGPACLRSTVTTPPTTARPPGPLSRAVAVAPAGRAAAVPAIRRSAALPSTVRAAAAQLDRPAGSPAGPTPARTAATPRLPGGLAVAASGQGDTGSARLGAFVQRSMVVAPPRVSVRPADLAPVGGGPAVPDSARHDRTGSPTTRPSAAGRQNTTSQHSPIPSSTGGSPPGVEVDGPVIRRSLSGAAHSLFRSLLRSPGAVGARAHPESVQSGSVGMFENHPQRMHSSGPDEPAVLRRLRESGGSSEPQFPGFEADEEPGSPAMRSRDFDELIDRIVAKLEQRVIDDLERRGRRHMPEVF